MDAATFKLRAKKILLPRLRELGFSEATQTTYWRRKPHCIDVLNIQFDKWNRVEGYKFSFFVNLGVYFVEVPGVDIKEKSGLLYPDEARCLFRERLSPGGVHHWEVDEDASSLDAVLEGLASAVGTQAEPWFESSGDRLNALAEIDGGKNKWINAPPRDLDYYAGHLLIAVGDVTSGLQRLERFLAVASKSGGDPPRIALAERTLHRFRQGLGGPFDIHPGTMRD